MREILFRGKSLETQKWLEGFYLKSPEFDNDGIAVITTETPRRANYVYKETIGQYTGLTDKNGKRIFEGDVIRFQKFKDEPLWIGVVVYENCLYIAKGVMPLSYEKREGEKAAKHGFEVQVSGINKSTIEVIGNIHDNPELLKGGVE